MPSERDDIAATLRDTACCWRGTDPIAIELRLAADEIERLRAELVRKADELAATLRELRKVEDERDEARRMVCGLDADIMEDQIEYAKHRGWDCFKENKR